MIRRNLNDRERFLIITALLTAADVWKTMEKPEGTSDYHVALQLHDDRRCILKGGRRACLVS